MKKYFIYSLFVFISCFFIKPVFALTIDAPFINSVSYVNDTSIKINYTTNNTNSNYKVQIYNMTIGRFYTTDIINSDYTITDLVTGRTDNIIMRVYFGTTVSDWSNIISATPKPGVPTLSSVNSGDKSLTLKYSVNGHPSSVEIYNSVTKTSISTGNLTDYTITNLTNGTTYSFLVRNCYDNNLCSGWSNSVSGTPKASAGGTSATPQPTTKAEYTPSSGKIGHAAGGEGGCSKGCTAGDKSGKEVKISNFSYSKNKKKHNHWTYVARFKDPAKAEKAAKDMEYACKNNKIGYDQKDRYKFYKAAKELNWNLSKLDKKIDTSCSSLVSICINYSGIYAPVEFWTKDSSMKSYFKKNSDSFTILTGSKYVTTYKNLKRGDILVCSGHHTAMAL